jgi:hypothetical protein
MANKKIKVNKSNTAGYKLPACWIGTPHTRYVQRGNKLVEVVEVHKKEDTQSGCKCILPQQAFLCMEGHLAECHVGMTCEQARCSHYQRNQGGIT